MTGASNKAVNGTYLPFNRVGMPSLLARLSRKLGRGQAATELRWLRDASNDEKEFQRMVIRRLKDEPLQYILGLVLSGLYSVLPLIAFS